MDDERLSRAKDLAKDLAEFCVQFRECDRMYFRTWACVKVHAWYCVDNRALGCVNSRVWDRVESRVWWRVGNPVSDRMWWRALEIINE